MTDEEKQRVQVELFLLQGDTASATALAMFGERFLTAPGWPKTPQRLPSGVALPLVHNSAADKMRRMARMFGSLALAGADAEIILAAVHAVIVSIDGEETAPYSSVTLREVRELLKRWLRFSDLWPACQHHAEDIGPPPLPPLPPGSETPPPWGSGGWAPPPPYSEKT